MLPRVWRSVCTYMALVAASGELSGQELAITWRGEARALDAVSRDAAAASATARAWLPFASATGSRLVLSDDARVLLVLCETYARRGPKKEHHDVEVMLRLVRNACAVTDRLLPAADAEPLVVVGVRTASYAKLLEHLIRLDPQLESWACNAGATVNGFILPAPLVAAWVDDPAGVDEWNPHNELVHRTAQLLVRRHTPRVPSWFLLGLAWHVEDTVQGSIYCFPCRSGFVSAWDHTDWGLCLANDFKPNRRRKDGKEPLLSMQEFAHWSPGSGDDLATGKAYIAFGVARYLAHERPSAVSDLATEFNAAIENGSKVWTSATEWRAVPDYHIPIAEQLAMLNAVEADLLTKATDYFQKKKANERRAPDKKR